jgi:hypothetical protein
MEYPSVMNICLKFRTPLYGSALLVAGALLNANVATAAPLQRAPGVHLGPDLTGVRTIASTVPPNGDVNPYGLVVVPISHGSLVAGNILISNFNSSQNLQGTGTTIMEISPSGRVSVFSQIAPHQLPGSCPGGIGLTTALAVSRSGFVFVGSLPTTNGMANTARAGCILVLNSLGQVVETFDGSLINGPWDMTEADDGTNVALFVTNVLNGTVAAHGQVVDGGTVVRLNVYAPAGSLPFLESLTVIGSGFSERTDPAALVIGPTGVGLSADGSKLYVADSLNNRIATISDPMKRSISAGIGTTFTSGLSLNDPLGLTVAANGDILTVNGNDGYLVRTSTNGSQLARALLDDTGNPPGAGALFGLAPGPNGSVYYVDDAANTLNRFH